VKGRSLSAESLGTPIPLPDIVYLPKRSASAKGRWTHSVVIRVELPDLGQNSQ